MTDLVERVYAPGDHCTHCGDGFEPGDLAVWGDTGRTHETCTDDAPTPDARDQMENAA
jgi:hypothetical protein